MKELTVQSVQSPNGQLALHVGLTDSGGLWYKLYSQGRVMMRESRLGLLLKNAPSLLEGFIITASDTGKQDEVWTPLYGERSRIPDRYCWLKLELLQPGEADRRMNVEFRVYDEGLAFRYKVPFQSGFKRFIISGEGTQFHFPEGCTAFGEQGAEGEYRQVPVEELPANCERPLTVVYPQGMYAAILEAGLDDYSRMLLQARPEQPGVVEAVLSGLLTEYVGYGLMDEGLPEAEKTGEVTAKTPFASPWRIVLVGETPGQLLEHNYMVLNLNDPCALAEPSWIKPGKLIRDMSLSSEGARACVDYAASMGLDYVMLDWGWYGDPFDDKVLCTEPENEVWFYSKHTGNHRMNIPELVQYADARGIGIILYLDRRGCREAD